MYNLQQQQQQQPSLCSSSSSVLCCVVCLQISVTSASRIGENSTHSPCPLLREREREREMRLLTHNMLSSNIKGVSNGFPLRIEVEKVLEKHVDFNADFLRNMFPKIEWKTFVDAARTIGYAELPKEVDDSSMLTSEEFLNKFHHALLELHLEEGALVCPETGRRFPVNKGIPNMLLHEDEV